MQYIQLDATDFGQSWAGPADFPVLFLALIRSGRRSDLARGAQSSVDDDFGSAARSAQRSALDGERSQDAS
jgi:hypothetical protein